MEKARRFVKYAPEEPLPTRSSTTGPQVAVGRPRAPEMSLRGDDAIPTPGDNVSCSGRVRRGLMTTWNTTAAVTCS